MYKKIIIGMLLLSCILIFNGCKPEPELPSSDNSISMVIMAGNHANSKNHDIQYYDKIHEVYESFGNVGVVVVDGTPEAVFDNERYLGFRDSDTIKTSKENYINNYKFWGTEIAGSTKYLNSKINELKADSPEVNTLMAFQESLKVLNLMGNDNKVILVHDTGLSTDGVLNFVNNNYLELSDEEIQQLVADLHEKKEIPNFSGVSVIWYGLGDTSAPQEELNAKHKDRLRQIWYQIITSTGGKVEFLDVPAHGVFDAEQNVSTVKLPEETSVIVDPPPSSFKLVDIFFEGDSDEYVDEDTAEALLNSIRDETKNNPESKWLIIGCAAGNTKLNISQLTDYISADRAKKIEKELIELGISDECLTSFSLGPYDPWHLPDSDGVNLIEEKAEFNRRVTIIKADSPEASIYSEILKEGKLD